MEVLIDTLERIRIAAKTVHYNYKGKDFYAIHKMMDKIQSPMIDFQDEIKEQFYMANNKNPPSFKSMYSDILPSMPDNYDLVDVSSLVKIVSYQIEEMKDDGRYNLGQQDILSKISSHLNFCMALLFGTLGENPKSDT